MTKLDNNVAIDRSRQVQLLCGHTTVSQPVAIFPDKRRLYKCPEGCGLVKSKRR